MFEMDRNTPAANSVRREIDRIEETIKYTKKTTRLHQNEKRRYI